uniref:Uncharacterized protein n=1 Tax=Rhizophora mucronata TaxID=61149 RepID=A0A2P2Q3K2_RHIMU
MELKIGQTYLFYKIAKDIWEVTQEIYSDLSNTAQCFEILSALRNTGQGYMTVTEYYNVPIEHWQEMDLFYNASWHCPEGGIKYDHLLEKEYV